MARHVVPRSLRGALARATVLVATAAALLVLAGAARANERCSIADRQLLCPDADPACPAGSGPTASAWPLFQHDAQHTGRSEVYGPSCNHVVWRWSGSDEFLSAPTVGADGTVYIGNARFPVCAIDPATGTTRWCDTDREGRLPDRSSAAVAADNTVYIGTRDDDLWAIAARLAPPPPVVCRQRVCTDGDIT